MKFSLEQLLLLMAKSRDVGKSYWSVFPRSDCGLTTELTGVDACGKVNVSSSRLSNEGVCAWVLRRGAVSGNGASECCAGSKVRSSLNFRWTSSNCCSIHFCMGVPGVRVVACRVG